MSLSIPASGYFYANKMARIYLVAIRDLLGELAYADNLRGIGLERYLDKLPPDNFDKQFDFSDFSMLTASLEHLQAAKPQKSPLPFEAGKMCFKGGLKTFGGLAGFSQSSLGFQVFPVNIRLKLGLQATAITFNTFSDQLTEVKELDDSYLYTIHRCPACWGQHADKPACSRAAGLLAAGLYWVTNREYRVTETDCVAVGADACTFVIEKTPLPE